MYNARHMKKNTLNNLSERLLYALELTRVKKADLARAINVQPQTIQHLCHGDVQSSRFTFELATALGLNTRWLATGEGKPFFSDDPKDKLFSEYKKIPLLNIEQLALIAKSNNYTENDKAEWVILKTEESNIFCTYINDVSMTPLFQPGAKIFFKKIDMSNRKNIKKGNIVVTYLPIFDSILIREVVIMNNHTYLSPLNKNLFKEIKLTNDVIIFGEVIECHFSISKK